MLRFACVGALLLAAASRAQSRLDPPAASIVGVLCVDVDEDDACGAGDVPLPRTLVRTSTGQATLTDDLGRFHIAAAGGEQLTARSDGSTLARPTTVAVFADGVPLGPTARVPPPVLVALPPAAVVPVTLTVRLPVRAPLSESGSAAVLVDMAGARPRMDAGGLVLDVPVAPVAGHTLMLAGQPLTGLVTVPLGDREARITLVDRAPDGRVQLVALRALRAPRESGGDQVVLQPPSVVARFDLPPAAQPSAPGRLLVPVYAAPGTLVLVNGLRVTVPPSGVAWAWLDVQGAAVTLEVNGVRAEVAVPVDPWVAVRGTLAGDVRLGSAGLTPFAQGHVDGLLSAPLPGGDLAAGAVLDDDVAAAALQGKLLLAPARATRFGRWLDADRELAVFGDDSQARSDNPGQLSLWARAQSTWGTAGVGPARAPLDESEAARLERPVLGPYADGAVKLGPVTIGAQVAADASAVPFVVTGAVSTAHVEIESSGGRVYWLRHQRIAPASERVVVATVDPLTGLVVDRRQLVRGADYDIDTETGRLVLAAPLGLVPLAGAGAARPGASGAGGQTRLLVDYAHEVDAADNGDHSGAGRVFVRTGSNGAGVEGGIGGALSEHAGLVVLDASAHPHPLLSLSASAAHSAGDWTQGASAGLRSLDSGLSWTTPTATAGGGEAAAMRIGVGEDGHRASLWGSMREAGFTDGSGGAPLSEGRAGAAGHLELWDRVALSALGEARTGADPTTPNELARLVTQDAAARAQGTLGPVRVAVDVSQRHGERATATTDDVGSAVGVGGEVGLRATPRAEVFVGHLQGVWADGSGPGARDPTFSYAGTRVTLPEGPLLDARLGVHPDLRPEGHLQLLTEDKDGAQRYGGFAASSDDPWLGRSLTSVSGARQQATADTDVFAEQRTSSTDAGVLSGRAAGAERTWGPFVAGASWENSERLADGPRTLRNAVTARLGLQQPLGAVHSFAEIASVTPEAGVSASQWALGASARATPAAFLSLGARALVGKGAPLSGDVPRPFSELLLGVALRPRGLPSAFVQYSLRSDRRAADDLQQRLQLLRGALSLGAAPGFTLLFSGTLADDAVADPTTGAAYAAQAALGSVRAEVPLWFFVPAVELGARSVFGAQLEPELAGTSRVEALFRLGPALLGPGVVLAGYTGSGLEPLTLEPAAPPVYLVLRGTLG